MSQVAATMGMSADEIRSGSGDFKMLEDAAKEAGRTTQFSATQAGEALNYLALAGYDAKKSVEAMPVVLNLAAAGGMDLAKASDMITDSMSALGLQTVELEGFADQMAKTSQKSNTSISQLGDAILSVGGTAKNLAGGTVELNTVLGILADNGIKGAEAGHSLRNIIQALTPSTNKAVDAFEKLGVETYDADGNLRPLEDTFRDLNSAMENLTNKEKTELLKAIFAKFDLKAATALMGATATSVDNLAATLEVVEAPVQNIGMSIDELAASFDSSQSSFDFQKKAIQEWGFTAEQAALLYDGLVSVVGESGDRFDQLSGYISDSAGATSEMAKVMIDNLSGMVKIFSSAMEGLGIEIYQAIDEPLKGVVESATNVISSLSDTVKNEGLSGFVYELGGVFASVALQAANAAPEMVNAASSMIQSFLDSINGNSEQLSQAALSLTGTLINAVLEIVPSFIQTGAGIVTSFVSGLLQNIPNIASTASQLIQNFINTINQNLPDVTENAMNTVVAFVEGLGPLLPQLLEAGTAVIQNLAQGIAESLPDLIPKGVEAIAALVESITGNLNTIIEAGIGILKSLGEGIINALPNLIERIPEIVINIADVINKNAPKLLMCAVELLGKLAVGLIENIPTIIKNIPKIIEAIIKAFTAFNWINLGKTIISSLAKGIANMLSGAKNAAKDIARAIKTEISSLPSKLLDIGKNIVNGLANGIKEGAGWAVKAIKNLASNMLDGIKDFFGIHSPSASPQVILNTFV